MWCSHCQQDVPAVARLVDGPLVCSCCRQELARDPARELSDTGIDLDNPKSDEDPWFRSYFEDEETRQRTRKIGRQLRNPYRFDEPTSRFLKAPTGPLLQPEVQLKSISRQAIEHPRSTKTAWHISLLLVGGTLGLLGGGGLLAWSLSFRMAHIWQWGITTTIVAEAMLILGLTFMAIRLWKNSRRLNQQLDGVGHQLQEIQEQTGALVSNQMSNSQHYYHHFSQAASPHFLVGSLRGQVEQLASRISNEN